MKKSKLLLVSAAALLGLGIGVASAASHSIMANAATFVDSTVVDNFATIDGEVYDKIDSGNKIGLVERNGVLKFGGMDYNVGFIRTSNAISRGTGSVVFEFTQLSAPDQYLCLCFNNGYGWGNMIMAKFAGAIVLGELPGGEIPPYNDAGTQTMWQGTNAYVGAANMRLRVVWNNDGSCTIYGSADSGATFARVCYFPANSFNVPESGYIGFMGNGLAGDVEIDNVKIGLADDADLTNLAWSVEDDFEVANKGTFVNDPTYATGNSYVENLGGLNAVVLDAPASGEGVISKKSYQWAEGATKLLDASLKFDPTSLSEQGFGLAFGLGENATAVTGAGFAGIRLSEGTPTLFLDLPGVGEAQSAAFTLSGEVTLKLSVYKDAEGAKVRASIGEVSVVNELPDGFDGAGRLGIGMSGVGASVIKLLNLTVSDYYGVTKEGRDLNIDFAKGIDHNWLVQETAGDSLAVEDGRLHFNVKTDTSFFETRQEYANFDLQFDAEMQDLYEDDETGAITPKCTWMGVSFGREQVGQAYTVAGSEMIFLTADTVNSIATQDGHTPSGVATPRGWFTPEQFPHGKNFHYHIRAVDGSVSFSMGEVGGAETTIIIWEGMQHVGHIAFAGTLNSGYFVDNIVLENLDETGVENQKPVFAETQLEHSVVQGESVTGQLDATDADAYDADYLTYHLVGEAETALGTLTLNEDGSYEYAAKEDATAGSVDTFAVVANDSEDDSDPITLNFTIEEKEDPITPPDPGSSEDSGSSEEPGPSVPDSSETPVTPTPVESSEPAKKGCGGAIIGTAIAGLLAAGAIVGIAAKKGKKDE